MGLFAGLALLLALVGIYGVLSCVVNERTREIGIRLALGAQRREVLWMILIRGMRSVAMGGLIGLAALVTRQEVLLVIVGGMFVLETLSVIVQVAWFRCRGARLLACSPLHNHFLFRGEHEMKIVIRFWIGAALLAIAGVASLKIR